MATTNTILLAEDHPDDAFLLRRALSRAGVANPPYVATSTDEAVNYLNGEGKFHDRKQFPLPRLMFVNLHIPQLGGIELVRHIRQQPNLNGLILIVLTGSSQPPDVDAAYQAGANAFISKPHTLAELEHAIKTTADFWLQVATLPGFFAY